LSISTILVLFFGTVPTVWFFGFNFFLYRCGRSFFNN